MCNQMGRPRKGSNEAWPRERVDLCLGLLAAGLSYRRVAKVAGVSDTTLRDALRRHGGRAAAAPAVEAGALA